MKMQRTIASLTSGLIFGLGLAVSGLTDPDKVLQFLTISPNWSPALLFTMGAAVAVTFVGYRWVLKRGPVLDDKLKLPTRTDIDRRLLFGAAIFGVGWGMGGFCPGPAITAMASGFTEPLIFIAAMLAGSQLQRVVAKS